MNELMLQKRLLSVIEILLIIIIILFIFEGTYQWTFYLILHHVIGLVFCLSFLNIILQELYTFSKIYTMIETGYSFLGILNENYQYHSYKIPRDVSINGWLNRLLVIMGALFILKMIFLYRFFQYKFGQKNFE